MEIMAHRPNGLHGKMDRQQGVIVNVVIEAMSKKIYLRL
jgi:hypothetical protein